MASNKPVPVVSRAEVAKHDKEGDGWVIVNDHVYNLSTFASLHPGGTEPLREHYGKDATEAFYSLHRQEVMEKYHPRLVVGRIEGSDPNAAPMESYADISRVPFAEAPFFRGDASPYWKPTHLEFRKAVRKWVHENLRQEAEAAELTGAVPSDEVFKALGDYGMLGMRLGPGPHLKYCPNGLPIGLPIDKFDYFHELICHEEIARLATPGFTDGIGSGLVIGAPIVINFCENEALREKVRGPRSRARSPFRD